jgi:hypothetical protein
LRRLSAEHSEKSRALAAEPLRLLPKPVELRLLLCRRIFVALDLVGLGGIHGPAVDRGQLRLQAQADGIARRSRGCGYWRGRGGGRGRGKSDLGWGRWGAQNGQGNGQGQYKAASAQPLRDHGPRHQEKLPTRTRVYPRSSPQVAEVGYIRFRPAPSALSKRRDGDQSVDFDAGERKPGGKKVARVHSSEVLLRGPGSRSGPVKLAQTA